MFSTLLNVFVLAAMSVSADTTIPCGACPSELTDDVTIDDCGALTVASTIDLKGHRLTLKDVTAITWGSDATFTSDAHEMATGELKIVHSSKVSQQTAFSGNLKFVKAGAGTWEVGSLTQSFTGGVIVEGGLLMTKKYGNIGEETPYGRNPTIDVLSEGTLDFNSGYGYATTTLNLRGGTIKNGRTLNNTAYYMKAPINVYADSTLRTDKDKTYNYNGALNLMGNTLTLDFGGTFYWHPTTAVNGTLHPTNGVFCVHAATEMPTVNLVADVALNMASECSVSNYVANYTGPNNGSASLKVFGRFSPNADSFYPPTMQDGSTIDLSMKKGSWVARGTEFANGATINIEVGSRRELTDGSMLVTWADTDYGGRTFNLLVDGAISRDFELQALRCGLRLLRKGTKVPTAIWSGKKSADALDPENWTWRDAPEDHPPLPDGTYAVEIAWTKLVNLSWPEADGIGSASLKFTGEKPTKMVVLTDGRDWRGLGGMDVPFSIDLAGKTLAMTFKGGVSAEATEVTSSVVGGVLIAKVASEKSFANTLVALSGDLTLVKDGAGTFVATKCPQTYLGDTIVSNGVMACARATNVEMKVERTDSPVSPFGAKFAITIAPHGVLDPAGSYGWTNHTIRLDGGMISNTVEATGLSSALYSADRKNEFNPSIVLTAPSTFATAATFNFAGRLQSDGNKLTLWIASGRELLWHPSAKVVSADIEVVNGGYLRTISHGPIDMKASTLTMTGGGLFVGGVLSVSNYIAASAFPAYRYDERTAADEAVALLNVYGTFKPSSDYFFGCTMQDGSALDLSEKESAWSIVTMATSEKTTGDHSGVKSAVDFVDHALVTIDIGARELKSGDRILSWSTAPSNLETLKFVLRGDETDSNFRLEVGEDGIYAVRKGLIISVR